MDTEELNNQVKLKQTQLQIADSNEQRQKIQNQLTVLRYKKEIEVLKEKINQLQSA